MPGLLRSRLRYYASDALPASHYYKWFAKTVCGERALVNVLCERLRDTPWQPLQAFPSLSQPWSALSVRRPKAIVARAHLLAEAFACSPATPLPSPSTGINDDQSRVYSISIGGRGLKFNRLGP